MKYRRLVYSFWGIILFLFVGHSSVAQTVTLSGYVYERGSLELLTGINVYEENSGMLVFSNEYGFYVMQIPYSDTLKVIFSGYGYAYDTLQIVSPAVEESYNPELIRITVLEDVIVRADRLTQDVQMSTIKTSSHLILCRPLLLLPPIPPSIRIFSSESTLRMRWPKYWSFSLECRRSLLPSPV